MNRMHDNVKHQAEEQASLVDGASLENRDETASATSPPLAACKSPQVYPMFPEATLEHFEWRQARLYRGWRSHQSK